MSNSSNSPPLPCTPPPRLGRSSDRYPGLGRVPLHRRGTSQTYERLEDLLREAGYKETRIFTPEGEHEEGTYHEDDSPSARRLQGGVREGVGAVVGFLTGLLPSSTTQSIGSVATTSDSERQNLPDGTVESSMSRSNTPVLSIRTQRQMHISGHSTPRTTTSSSDDIQGLRRNTRSPTLGTPVPQSPYMTRSQSPYCSRHYPQHPQYHAAQRTAGHPGLSQNVQRSPLSRQSSLRVVHELSQQQQSSQPIMPLAQPHPSRATAYLRRVASRSDVPERPNSTPVHSQPRVFLNDEEVNAERGNGEGEEDHRRPPLPRTWLETVARVVLFGGTGVHIGGPLQQQNRNIVSSPTSSTTTSPKHDHMLAKGRAQALRHARSSLSQVSSRSQPNPRTSRAPRLHGLRTTLTDQGNKSQSKLSLLSASTEVSVDMLSPPELFLRVGRGRATYSESRVSHARVYCRSAPSSRSASNARDGGFLKGQGRGSKKDRVPSLAKTKVEDDMWARPKKRKAGVDSAMGRPLYGWNADVDCGARYVRNRHQASMGLGDRMDYSYSSEAAIGYGYANDGHGLGSDGEGEGSDDDDDDDDDDEGELDLARILVPPKRQHSIISLRKHLVAPTRVAGMGASSKSRAAASASRLGDGMGIGEFGREIEAGGGASAALSRVAGSTSTIPAMRIRGGYGPGHGKHQL
ncbi:hypothetical protein AX15_007859 [Amanita polypyramis BW_CC]|nr:hypothetical protein AX15_007859 [Amanita polypyramis BW_CC]